MDPLPPRRMTKQEQVRRQHERAKTEALLSPKPYTRSLILKHAVQMTLAAAARGIHL